jgi:TrmH family RNA methyltransferase
MLTKKQIHSVQSLKDVSVRRESRSFIAEGPKLVSELLCTNYPVRCVYAVKEWMDLNQDKVQLKMFPYEEVTPVELKKISQLATPNQVLAVAGIPPVTLDWNLINSDLTLVLDGIQDPGNLGTMIRIADWFAIRQIICSKGSADIYNPKVVQSTMGSVFRVKVFYEELPEFLSDLSQKLPVYGAFLEGEPLDTSDIQNNGLLVIGSESHGISPQVESLVTHRVKIPSFPVYSKRTGAESLNASVAAGILCYNFRFLSKQPGHQC